MTGESVNHPAHYRHPSGVECIDIIRHYTCDIANAMKYLWRAGLKSEEGMTLREKEIEDCRKAVWYLNDYRLNVCGVRLRPFRISPHPSGHRLEAVTACYCAEIRQAFRMLWHVGLIVDGEVVRDYDEGACIRSAIESIEAHISKLETHEGA